MSSSTYFSPWCLDFLGTATSSHCCYSGSDQTVYDSALFSEQVSMLLQTFYNGDLKQLYYKLLSISFRDTLKLFSLLQILWQ
jgi:hypothetical protein